MSALSIEPNDGIRLDLSNYFLIRTSQASGAFWEHQNQQIIRQSMGDFFPKALADGKKSVLFQHYMNGSEVCSASVAVTASNPVPATELSGVQSCLAALKEKGLDPHCDPNARKFIESLRLPDPSKDPELYRLYGPARSRRLLILWGLEKEADTAIGASEAVARIPVKTSGFTWKPWAAGFALLLLLAILLLFFFRPEKQLVSGNNSKSGSDVSPRGNGAWADGGNRTFDQGGANPGQVNPPLAAHSIDGTAPSLSNPTERNHDGSSISLPSSHKDGSEVKVPSNPAPGSPQRTVDNGDAASAEPPARGEDPKSPKGNSPQSALEPPPKADDPAPPPSGNIPPSSSDKSGEIKPESKRDSPPGSPGKPNASPNPKSQPTLPKKASEQPANSTAPSLLGEIVNSRTSSPPKDGKVETLLSLLARDSDGSPVTIETVSEWVVDGKTMKNEVGTNITTNGLPLSLSEGKHRVMAKGTDSKGQPIIADAELDVDIAVREESNVRLKQHPAKEPAKR